MLKYIVSVLAMVTTFGIGSFLTLYSEPAQASVGKVQRAVPMTAKTIPTRPIYEKPRSLITANFYDSYLNNQKTFRVTSKALTNYSGRSAEQMADTIQFSYELAQKFTHLREEIEEHRLTQSEIGLAEKDIRQMELELYQAVIKGLDHIAATGKTSRRGLWKGGGFWNKAIIAQTKEKIQEWYIQPLL